MIASVLSVTLLGVAAAQEPAPVASSVANTERFGLCAAPATAPSRRAGPLYQSQSSGALERPPSRLNTKRESRKPTPPAPAGRRRHVPGALGHERADRRLPRLRPKARVRLYRDGDDALAGRRLREPHRRLVPARRPIIIVSTSARQVRSRVRVPTPPLDDGRGDLSALSTRQSLLQT